MIGAGVGAAGGAISGQNRFKAALLGAGLGAGGAGLMGAGAAGGAGAAAGTAGTGAGAGLIGGANLSTAGGLGLGSGAAGATTSGLGNFLSSIKGVETTPVSLGTGGYASGIGGQVINAPNALSALPGQTLEESLNLTIPRQNLADTVSPESIANSGFPKFDQSGFNNLGAGPNVNAPFSTEAFTNNPLMQQQIANNAGQTVSPSFFDSIGLGNLTTMDKIGLGKTALDAGFPNQAQQMIQPQTMPITRGNPEMASTPLFNVGPNIGMQQGNEIGLPNLKTTIPLTEEEILRLQQQLQSTGFRGR
jgi:hypothetical protein